MSRFSGLPDPLANQSAKPGTRFAGLKDALGTVTPENGTRTARVRADRAAAAARGSGGSTRLAAHQALKGDAIGNSAARKAAVEASTPAQAPAMCAKSAAKAPAKVVATTTPPKRKPMAVPADVEARGQAYADAYRASFKQANERMASLAANPRTRGKSLSLAAMFGEGLSNAEILDRIESAPDDKRLKADRVWDRAWGRDGQSASAAPIANKADAVWAKARASIDASRLPRSAAQEPVTGAKTNSTDDIWARAYAAAR